MVTDDWEVWYRDTFDRETPPRCEIRGHVLVDGLMELWARHLFEAVRPNGEIGFSRFHLQSGSNRIEIEGPPGGALRLRQWVFGTKEHAELGYVAAADATVLRGIASAHASLIEKSRTSDTILVAALASTSWDDCEQRL